MVTLVLINIRKTIDLSSDISSQIRTLMENCPNCIEQRKNIKESFWKKDFQKDSKK